MIFGILPVKSPTTAKQRLAAILSQVEREALARAMFTHVLHAMLRARGFDTVAVATSDERIASEARRAGALVFEETVQLSHSHSADAAARRAAELGAKTVVLLPIDVPLVRPCEIESLIQAPLEGLGIVPSGDGTGTNALVRTPPDAIESRFGPGSFQAHLDQAVSKSLQIRVLRPPGIVFDVDTPEDWQEFLRQGAQPFPVPGRYLGGAGCA